MMMYVCDCTHVCVCVSEAVHVHPGRVPITVTRSLWVSVPLVFTI